MRINIGKIQFYQKEIDILFHIEWKGNGSRWDKKSYVPNYSYFGSVAEFRRFLWMTGWFRNFILDLHYSWLKFLNKFGDLEIKKLN